MTGSLHLGSGTAIKLRQLEEITFSQLSFSVPTGHNLPMQPWRGENPPIASFPDSPLEIGSHPVGAKRELHSDVACGQGPAG